MNSEAKPPEEICFFGSYSVGPAYSRTSTFIKELRSCGYFVSVCHADLWANSREKIGLTIVGKLKLVFQFIKVQFKLMTIFFREHRSTDIVFVGTACYQDLPLAFLISSIFSKALIFDAFYSLYDTVVLDRKLVKENSFVSRVIKTSEAILLRLPDSIIMDTEENSKFLRSEFNVRSPVYSVPPGVPSEFLMNEPHCETCISTEGMHKLVCVFYGSYVPLQGAAVIIRSAVILQNYKEIQFVMIGSGQEHDLCMKIASDSNLSNVTFKPWMSMEELSSEVCNADICLGIFGSSAKASRVIPYKVYSYMAEGKPIITMRSPAMIEILEDGIDVLFCQAGNPEELAECILKLKDSDDFRTSLSENVYAKYLDKVSNPMIGKKLYHAVGETLARNVLGKRKSNS